MMTPAGNVRCQNACLVSKTFLLAITYIVYITAHTFVCYTQSKQRAVLCKKCARRKEGKYWPRFRNSRFQVHVVRRDKLNFRRQRPAAAAVVLFSSFSYLSETIFSVHIKILLLVLGFEENSLFTFRKNIL